MRRPYDNIFRIFSLQWDSWILIWFDFVEKKLREKSRIRFLPWKDNQFFLKDYFFFERRLIWRRLLRVESSYNTDGWSREEVVSHLDCVLIIHHIYLKALKCMYGEPMSVQATPTKAWQHHSSKPIKYCGRFGLYIASEWRVSCRYISISISIK